MIVLLLPDDSMVCQRCQRSAWTYALDVYMDCAILTWMANPANIHLEGKNDKSRFWSLYIARQSNWYELHK